MRADKSQDETPRPLVQAELSLELYVLLNETNHISWTVRELTQAINERFRDNFKTRRIKQVLEYMTRRGRIIKVYRPHPSANNKQVATFQATNEEAQLSGGTLWEVTRAIILVQNAKEEKEQASRRAESVGR